MFACSGQDSRWRREERFLAIVRKARVRFPRRKRSRRSRGGSKLTDSNPGAIVCRLVASFGHCSSPALHKGVRGERRLKRETRGARQRGTVH